jgi:hypothetical protein
MHKLPKLPTPREYAEIYIKAHPELTEVEKANIRQIAARCPVPHVTQLVRKPIDPLDPKAEAG